MVTTLASAFSGGGFGSRILAAILAFLLIIGITANALATRWEPVINSFLKGTPFEATSSKLVSVGSSNIDSEYFKSDYDSFEEYYEAGRELNQRIEAEGAVLLKNNNNTLPLSRGAEVSVFGYNSTKLVYGGTGSGEAKGSAYPTMKEALENEKAGIKVNPELWNYYSGLTSAPKIESYPANVVSSYGSYDDAAIVLIARGAGEGQDVSRSPNTLTLTQAEKDMLTVVKDKFDKVIVLLNTTNAMELGDLAGDEYGVDSVLWIGPVGQYGMYGVADLLVGNVNPSGRLIDTYSSSSFSAPATTVYGVNGLYQFTNFGGTNFTAYLEGIYVGYRYYETRYEDCVLGQGNASSSKGSFNSSDGWNYSEEVTYPFGYGLSYTTFTQTLDKVTLSGGVFTAEITVKNTGSVAGKTVVQVYGQQPYTQYDIENGIEKSAVELVGFTKTEIIPAGESRKVTVEIDKKYFASYDSKVEKTYILEPGDYYMAIGDNAHDALNNILAKKGHSTANSEMDANGNADNVYMWTESEFDAKTFSISNGTKITNRFDDADLNKYQENTVTYLSRNDWSGTWPSPPTNVEAAPSLIEKYDYKQITTDTDLSKFSFGEQNGIMLAMLIDADYDDPHWDLLLNQLTVEELISIVAWNGRQANPTIGLVESAFADSPNGIATDANSSYKGKYKDIPVLYFPNGSVLASSWNHELAEEYGKMNGETGLYTGNTGWFAPAVNLHRTPFSGRNFEYYGEDPILSGEICSDVVVGAQSKGVYVMVKHFALNDQESGRQGLGTFANEQTIRQIYLRAFEIPVVEGEAQGIMSAFNRIGPWWAGMCHGLLTDVLRNEWGFNGIVITDQFMANSFMDMACAVIAGNTSVCNPNGDNGIAALTPYSNDAEVVAAVRESAHRILYVIANSNAMNGVDADMRVEIVTPWYRVMTLWWIIICAVLLAIMLVLTVSSGMSGGAGLPFMIVSAICGAVALIGYFTFEANMFTSFPEELLTFILIALIANVVTMILPIPLGEFVPMIVYGLAFSTFCDTQSFFISNVFVGIDGNTFSAPFIMCFAGLLLAIISGGIACALNPRRSAF